jgi:hypothetical protein
MIKAFQGAGYKLFHNRTQICRFMYRLSKYFLRSSCSLFAPKKGARMMIVIDGIKIIGAVFAIIYVVAVIKGSRR